MKTIKFHSILRKFALILLFSIFGLFATEEVREARGQEAPPWTDATQGGPLGVAKVDVEETPTLTTITGWDPEGREVGRIELVHGLFELSGIFVDNSDEPLVMGRRLEVIVLGQRLHWETEGFAPTLGLPTHPDSQWALAAFLEDLRVIPLLERWGIGFQAKSQSSRNKDAPFICDLEGTHPFECSGERTCKTLLNRLHPEDTSIVVPGTCGRSIAADAAWTVHQTANADYNWDWEGENDPDLQGNFNQSFIAQCCRFPGGTPQYAKKSCSDSISCVGDSCKTTCGTTGGPGRCVGCPDYTHDDTNEKCELRVQFAGWVDPSAPNEVSTYPESVLDNKVYEVCAHVAWTCGDGYCDSDEDCASCAADCACHKNSSCVAATAPGESARCCKSGKCETE